MRRENSTVTLGEVGAEIFALGGHFREAQNNGMDVLPSVFLFQCVPTFWKMLILT